ncbi:MAG: Fic family protein [Chlamydiae bacterium]|nr:Fic family protein [Chlamydiota bacterium]
MSYNPSFQITSETIKHLGRIEASREILEGLDIPLSLGKIFRQEASAKMTHKQPITEKLIKKMHAIIQKGIVQGKLRGEYREAQNAIYDVKTRKAVYLPPEAKDIGPLMRSFVGWLNQESGLHPVLKAGIGHYQLVTLHPFMDGNGRTARALVTLLLYREKYDLKQFYSLEEYYAEDLKGYYDTLHQCQGFNYYDHPNPDITPWIDYFAKGVAVIFEELKEKVLTSLSKHLPQRSKRELELLQAIGPREKRILHFFRHHLQLRTKQLSTLFHIKDRTARNLLTQWIEKGFILKQGSGKRNAYYILSDDYRQLIGDFKETTVLKI